MKKIGALVYVSEKAAILAGRSEYGRDIVAINPAELTPEQRDELVACSLVNMGGEYYHDVTSGTGLPLVAEATVETVVMLLEARRVLRAEEEEHDAEEKARQVVAHNKCVEKWLAANLEDFLSAPANEFSRWTIRRPGTYNAPPADERLDELNAAAVLLMAERNNVLELSREMDRKANKQSRLNREAAEKARVEAQSKQIRKWVNEYGTSDQKERQAANVLPREEIVDCIRSQVFSALDEFDRFERLQADDVCKQEYCPAITYDHVSWETSDAETVTSEQWKALQAIRDSDGTVTATLRRHYGECDCGCEGETERFSIRVEIKIGAFTFSREYAAPGTDEHVDVEE